MYTEVFPAGADNTSGELVVFKKLQLNEQTSNNTQEIWRRHYLNGMFRSDNNWPRLLICLVC